MASVVSNTVKQTAGDLVRTVQETDWKGELSAFGKEVETDAKLVGSSAAGLVEALPLHDIHMTQEQQEQRADGQVRCCAGLRRGRAAPTPRRRRPGRCGSGRGPPPQALPRTAAAEGCPLPAEPTPAAPPRRSGRPAPAGARCCPASPASPARRRLRRCSAAP
jgi:hypothetical protein